MKTKQISFLALLLVGFFFFNGNVYSQETKESKKALDAFINATTKSTVESEPVSGAEIIVELVSADTKMKTSKADGDNMEIVGLGFEKKKNIECKSNEKGEFSFSFQKEQLQKLPEEFQLKFTIKPKDPSRFPVENNSVVIKVKKSDGPKFTFVVTYQKPTTKSNKGYFAISSKAQSGW